MRNVFLYVRQGFFTRNNVYLELIVHNIEGRKHDREEHNEDHNSCFKNIGEVNVVDENPDSKWHEILSNPWKNRP